MELIGDVGHLKSRFFPYGDSVSVVARYAWFALDIALAQRSFWTHSMVPLGEEAQLEAHFGPFGHSGNLDARSAHGLRRTYHKLRNRFGPTRWKLLADMGRVESSFGPFGDGVSFDVR